VLTPKVLEQGGLGPGRLATEFGDDAASVIVGQRHSRSWMADSF
jgi:hypothetical protein